MIYDGFSIAARCYRENARYLLEKAGGDILHAYDKSPCEIMWVVTGINCFWLLPPLDPPPASFGRQLGNVCSSSSETCSVLLVSLGQGKCPKGRPCQKVGMKLEWIGLCFYIRKIWLNRAWEVHFASGVALKVHMNPFPHGSKKKFVN